MIFTHEAPCFHCWISLLQLIFCSKVDLPCIVVTARPKFIPISVNIHRSPMVIPTAEPSLSKKILPSTSTNGLITTFESISAAGMGLDSQVSFSLLKTSRFQSEQGLCRARCHLLAEWTQIASPGVNRCLNSDDHNLISRGMVMTFWQKGRQGDKRHFLLSLTWWLAT